MKDKEISLVVGGVCACYCQPDNYDMGHVPDKDVCEGLCRLHLQQDSSMCIGVSSWDIASFVESFIFTPPRSEINKQLYDYKKLS